MSEYLPPLQDMQFLLRELAPLTAMLDAIGTEIGLSEVIEQSSALLNGRLRGRAVVNVDR